ncbi:FAD binding domain-containing protein [Pseudomonas sp. NFIX10]|uniref:FAD-dependent monooxygenase n=1 Tax=unclassified Pseudomonas TaxID=196821 RepID=UPI0008F19B3A|nr:MULTISPECIES: FAD-dependent monooxygenase [unclassified Pseudomonas]SFB46409.1 FAD binding domain-containing protein [Pseudomonas sp. NFIX10]SFF19020.1 FAD binding domain-containing protein [Pseudomonas sp. NFACC06-1]
MNAVKKVLIVGGGIGGLCAAIALRRQGIEVDLVELKTQWTVYGVGIIQQSNVFREMAKSGVLDGYLDAACAFEDVTINTTAGERLARIPGQRLAGPEYPANVGISRLALHQVLSETVAALGVSVRLGLSVESLEQVGEGVDVLFTDTRRGRYDLVVGADGLYSHMRGLLFGEQYSPRFTGQAVWRYNFPRAAGIDHLATFQGAAGMAIEDAVVLGEELVAGGSVVQLPERFMARRYERCKFISDSSVLAGDKEMAYDSSFDRIGLVRRMLDVTAAPI